MLKERLTLKTFAVPSPPPTYTPERISRIRKSLPMSQGVFAHVLNVSTKTVQSWEQGLREPTQAAHRLLEVLEKKPEIIATLQTETSATRVEPAQPIG